MPRCWRASCSGLYAVGAAPGSCRRGCRRGLQRPGRYALAKTPIGVDFHLLSVHFDSGRISRDYHHRRQAAQRMSQINIGNTPILKLDRDVLVLGDYNTMGRQDSPPISAQEELAVFDGELAPGFRRLGMTPNCTEYFEGKAGALDHVVASTGMQEVAATACVTGYCALAACENESMEKQGIKLPVAPPPPADSDTSAGTPPQVPDSAFSLGFVTADAPRVWSTASAASCRSAC